MLPPETLTDEARALFAARLARRNVGAGPARVLMACCAGHTSGKEQAVATGFSLRTVVAYWERIHAALGTRSREQAVYRVWPDYVTSRRGREG